MLDEVGSHNFTEDDGSRDVRQSTTVGGDDDVSSRDDSMTSVLNHSNTGPFTAVPAGNHNSSDAEDRAVGSGSGSAVLTSSFATPERLASKPPLPQRSGTLSPRDTSSRPRPTHRRSQSLQHFTPAGSIVPLTGTTVPATDKSTVSTDNRSSTQNDAAPPSVTESVPGTHEIFV